MSTLTAPLAAPFPPSRRAMPCVAALVLALCAGVFVLAGCSPNTDPATLIGDWRGVLASPGGELPFTLRVEDGGGWVRAVVINGEERAPVSRVEIQGKEATFFFDGYDSEIRATLVAKGRLEGRWRKTGSDGDSTLAFSAEKGDTRRFLPVDSTDTSNQLDDVSGSWAVTFLDEDGDSPARGELTQVGERVTGTFLTPTGDYRFLEGRYAAGSLRLSTFDGAHAFLFTASATPDGQLEGDFWSRDSYHATWTARRLEGEDANEVILPDAWQQVGLTNDEGRFNWSFPDVDGEVVSSSDLRFRGKVVVVTLFGTWCPNCNDEAPLLAAWYRRYHEEGLEIVGLAYEMTDDVERDRRQLRRFAERYSISYPLLLAGTSDKQAAAATLPDLTGVLAYPTTIFIDRSGKTRKIHSGFAGPGTGAHHNALVSELEGLIRELLAEPAG